MGTYLYLGIYLSRIILLNLLRSKLPGEINLFLWLEKKFFFMIFQNNSGTSRNKGLSSLSLRSKSHITFLLLSLYLNTFLFTTLWWFHFPLINNIYKYPSDIVLFLSAGTIIPFLLLFCHSHTKHSIFIKCSFTLRGF